MGVGRQWHTLSALPLGDPAPTVQEAGWTWDQTGSVQKILPPPEFKPWILQSIISHYIKKLHWLPLLRVDENIYNYMIYDGQHLMVLQLQCGGMGLTTPHEKYKHITICYTWHPAFQDWVLQWDLENMAFHFHHSAEFLDQLSSHWLFKDSAPHSYLLI
jgi:hypothetical protein